MSKQLVADCTCNSANASRAHVTLIGLSRTSLWRRVRAGDFPAPVRLGGQGSRAVG